MNTKKSIADSIMEAVEALKASILDKMINFGINNITTPNHYITYRECERTSIDKKRLKAEFPELFSTLSKVSKYKGRKKKEYIDFDSIIEKWKNGDITASKAMRELGMSKSTFYRRVRNL